MNMASNIYSGLRGDKWIWGMVIVLGLSSILAVYSAVGSMAYKMMDGNTEYYLIKQIVFIALGACVMYIAYLLHYMQYSRLAPLLLIITIPLLIYTIGFSDPINNARRWITLPWINQTFQTSDFAKLALIIYLARALSKKQDYIKDFKSAFLPVLMPVILICGLIAPADLSTAGLLFVTCLMMMFVGRIHIKYIGLLILMGFVMFVLLIIIGKVFPDFVRVGTWMSRMDGFLNEGGHQVLQSKIAIAEGGWFGVGPGNSIQRNYLPYPYADFIYAIICEEYGFVGGLVIIGIYLGLLFRCIGIVTNSPKTFGAILAMGLCLSIVIQAFANIAVSVQLVPVTGLTLPMVSMGGTSVLFTCISFGIILSISKYIEDAKIRHLELAEIENQNEEAVGNFLNVANR